jgi:uncharacterized protein (DUF58 family)
VRITRVSLTVGLQVALLLGLPGCAWSQDTQDAVAKREIEVEKVTFEPRNPKVGDDITVSVSLHNTREHLVVTNVKLTPPSAYADIIPDAEQILFLEGDARRDAKWRARIVASG